MTLDYSVPGLVSIDMSHYVKKMVKEFPQENLKRAPVASQWHENLFNATQQWPFRKGTSQAIPHCDHTRTVSMEAWLLES